MDKAIEAAARAILTRRSISDPVIDKIKAANSWDWQMAYLDATAAIKAAAPLLRAEIELEVVEWLAGMWNDPAFPHELARAIQRGQHRKQPMDLETARDRTWP